MPDEPPETKSTESTRRAKLLDACRTILADETASEDSKEIAREMLRRLDVRNS